MKVSSLKRPENLRPTTPKETNLMPLELKKMKNSNKRLENTKKPPPSSLNAEDFSPTTYKPPLEKTLSSKELTRFTQKPS
jgi:hypothetical protein